jgi:hypothetical protein
VRRGSSRALNATTGAWPGAGPVFRPRPRWLTRLICQSIARVPVEGSIAAPRAGQRRAPELLQHQYAGVHSYIKGPPGRSVRRRVSVGTRRDLSLVLRKLLDERKDHLGSGQKRHSSLQPTPRKVAGRPRATPSWSRRAPRGHLSVAGSGRAEARRTDRSGSRRPRGRPGRTTRARREAVPECGASSARRSGIFNSPGVRMASTVVRLLKANGFSPDSGGGRRPSSTRWPTALVRVAGALYRR